MSAPEIFLSYNRADGQAVLDVQKLLEARSITTFLDRNNLVAGLPWPQALEEGLHRVRGVAVFIGRELGEWQKREMWFALDRQVREAKQGHAFPVIPVLLPGADVTPSFLFANTWIDLRGGLDAVVTAEALDAFGGAINSTQPPQAPERPTAICPYRGLQVFREEHAAFFFGRKAFADRLLDFTLGKDLVAVVGPSGSGKSSVVQAGLLPLLRRERPPANTWDAVSFTPGNDPFRHLASALIPLLEPEMSETARLAEAEELGRNLVGGRTRVEAVVSRVIEKSNGTGRLLLVADQFEELFTLTPERGRRPFAQALLRALGSAPFTLVITLRADFYSQIITLDRKLSDRLTAAQVNIGALTQGELREGITAPARLVRLEFEPGLVERILADVGSEPGHLPLVEFALTELWQRRDGSRLANQAYDEIGGATGALAQRAETEFGRLKPEEQTAAHRLFSRLVRVARPEEAGEDTRQRTDLSDADAVAKRVANMLADARLLVTSDEAKTGALTVEVAHEALIRNWERLRVWLNEDREFLLWRQRLQVQVAEWQERRQDVGYLLRGTPLSEAERWLLGRPQDLADAERHLIRESIALREREREEEEERRKAEIENARRLKEAAEARAEAERQRTAEQAAAARLLRVLVALAVIVLVASGVAFYEYYRRQASDRSLAALARQLEGSIKHQLQIDPVISDRIKAAWAQLTPDQQRRIGPLTFQGNQLAMEVSRMGSARALSSVEPPLLLVHSILTDDADEVLRNVEPGLLNVAPDGALWGISKYGQLDQGWTEAAAVWLENLLPLFGGKTPFRDTIPQKIAIPNRVQIALAGDWGTGNWRTAANPAPSTDVGKHMAILRTDLTIHLGGVYYAGTTDQEQHLLVNLWPQGSLGSLALNSDYEMYSGGKPYFEHALTSSLFRLQQQRSFFALENDNWVIVGLDSAYYADAERLYMDGTLYQDGGPQLQLDFLRAQAAKGKKIIVLTHHNGLTQDGSATTALWSQVMSAFPEHSAPAYWYWGHVHSGVVYRPKGPMNVLCRSIGHGGVPWGRASVLANNPNVVWYENRPAFDRDMPQRVLNGFVVLYLDGPKIFEVFYDENGGVAWP